MKFLVTIDRDEDGVWVVECPAIPGCVSQGNTKEEAVENIRDAIKLCLDVRSDKGLPITIESLPDEFDLVCQNQELMEFLEQRSRPSQTYTIEEARKILEID
jgi:predicted RNase H-like HicB family nuclease